MAGRTQPALHSLCDGVASSLPSLCRGTRSWRHLLAGWLLLLLLTVTGADASPAALCRGIRCYNGGSLEVHGNLWGSCRCVCPRGFAGMTCQYWRAGKRSGERGAQADLELAERYNELRSILVEMEELAQSLPSS